MLNIKHLCYNPKSQKNYCQIFGDNFVYGWKIGTATLISNSVVIYGFAEYTLVQHSFVNRAIEIGIYNTIQQSFAPFKETNYTDISLGLNAYNAVNNPIYRGMAQSNKFLTNLWSQNELKSSYKDLASSFANEEQQLIKGLFITSQGMTRFFMVGEIERKITDPAYKLIYTGTLSVVNIGISSQLSIDGTSEVNLKTGANLLNFKDTMGATVGLIVSFGILDASQNLMNHIAGPAEIEKDVCNNNLFGLEDSSFELIKEWAPLVTLTVTSISIIAAEVYSGQIDRAIQHTYTLFAFSAAKAIGVTSIEIAEDYIDLSGIVSIDDFDFI